MASKYPTVPEGADVNMVGQMDLSKIKAREKIPEEKIPRNPESAFIAAKIRHAQKLKSAGYEERRGALRAPIKSRLADVSAEGVQALSFRATPEVARKVAEYVKNKFKVGVTIRLSQETTDTINTLTKYDTAGRAYLSTRTHSEIAKMRGVYEKEKNKMKGKIMSFPAWVGATVVPEIHMQMM